MRVTEKAWDELERMVVKLGLSPWEAERGKEEQNFEAEANMPSKRERKGAHCLAFQLA